MSKRILRAVQDGITASMSDDERRRWLAGRYDWREDDWEDHCGNPDCDHPCCARSFIPYSRSREVRA